MVPEPCTVIKGRTNLDGKLNLSFALADRNKKSYIVANLTPKKEGAPDLIIPVNANRPENIDLQFMPEGGAMVAGLPGRLAFKAVAEDGHGTNVSGNIYNKEHELVTTFKSTYKGMGIIEFPPTAGEAYIAEMALPDGTKKSYPLPLAAANGTTMRINSKGTDSLDVMLCITPDIMAKGGSYYLVGQTAGVIYYAAVVNFKRQFVRPQIAKALFPTGVTHFTLFDAAHQPLNERIIFINHHDQLRINISPNQLIYTPRDSVALNIQVTDQQGKPAAGAFSVAVTDDNQVKPDSLGANILNSLLLTGDLKGDIEQPAYYLSNDQPETLAALDNLMLTQGWVGYNWKQVYAPFKAPGFDAEKEFLVKGKVTNLFNKPIDKAKLVLLSKKPLMVMDTITGPDGRFAFKGIMPADTPSYLVQARNKRGGSFAVGIDVDELKPLAFTPPAYLSAPWYVNTDTTVLHSLKITLAQQIALDNIPGKGAVIKRCSDNGQKNSERIKKPERPRRGRHGAGRAGYGQGRQNDPAGIAGAKTERFPGIWHLGPGACRQKCALLLYIKS
jgi:hypothetical protein